MTPSPIAADESTRPAAGSQPRRWYHLHVVTCIAVVVVAGSFGVMCSFANISETGSLWTIESWPLSSSLPLRPSKQVQGNGPFILVTFIEAVAFGVLLSGTATFCELWLRQVNRKRFRLQSLFLLTAAVAVVLAFAKWDYSLEEQSFNLVGPVDYAPLFNDWTPVPFALPPLVSLASTIYTALLLATRLAGWSFRFVAGRFRRSAAGGNR